MKSGKSNTAPTAARVITTVLLVLGFILIGAFWMRYNDLKRQNEALAAKVETVSDNNALMREEIAAPFDDEYVKRVARRSLGYCMPGEIIYFSNLQK